VAVAISYTEKDPEVIHLNTYQAVRESVPSKRFSALVGVNQPKMHARYRSAMASNPDYFMQQLPFFSVKPLYPFLMTILHFGGLSLVDASVSISNAAYFALGVLIYAWVSRYLPALISLIIAYGLSSFPLVTYIARISTPDALSALIVLLAIYLYIEQRSYKIALAVLVGSVGARPDNIFLLAPVLTYAGVSRHISFRYVAILALTSGVFFVSLVKMSGYYSWSTLFYSAFVELPHRPASFQSPLMLVDYLNVYKKLIIKSFLSNDLVLFGSLAVLAIIMRFALRGSRDLCLHFLIIDMIYLYTHFLIYPSYNQNRMYAAAILLILISLVVSAGELISDKRISQTRIPGEGFVKADRPQESL
jgi:hypothetical protein